MDSLSHRKYQLRAAYWQCWIQVQRGQGRAPPREMSRDPIACLRPRSPQQIAGLFPFPGTAGLSPICVESVSGKYRFDTPTVCVDAYYVHEVLVSTVRCGGPEVRRPTLLLTQRQHLAPPLLAQKSGA